MIQMPRDESQRQSTHENAPDPLRQMFAIAFLSVVGGFLMIPMQYMGGQYAGPIKWDTVAFGAISFGLMSTVLVLSYYFETGERAS